MKSRWLWVFLVAVVGVGVYVGSVLATPAVNQTTSTIAKSTFDPIKIKAKSDPANVWRAMLKTRGQSDVYVVDNKFSPVDHVNNIVAGTGWHSHPGPSLIFVLSGTVTNYTSDDTKCTGQKHTAGQGSSTRARTCTTSGTRATCRPRPWRCSCCRRARRRAGSTSRHRATVPSSAARKESGGGHSPSIYLPNRRERAEGST
jgi:hypothetical protein